ncbi:translocation/assembly module TamB domain-containing protein [Carboxylicivirga caseinilyticus]|uniref:translocation/assembly module TamB domain-containing protein n=1 Tax=Carboxylicivirga caseinilyticus TaxID=3417572 RepID=UPI003D3306DC|nr:translocation/assembly module TamB [Marinilabiliaceae bacterium A049]
MLVLIPAVQTRIVSYLTNQLSEEFNTEISVGKVYIKPFSSVILKNVLVKDQQNDTLMFVESLTSHIDSVYFRDKRIYLSSLSIKKPHINIYQQDSLFNYQFLFRKKIQTDTIANLWRFGVKSVNLTKGDVVYKKTKKDPILIKGVDVVLSEIHKDSVFSLRLDELRLTEKGGFIVQGASGLISAGKENLTLSQMQLKTYNSRIDLDSLFIHYNNSKQGPEKLEQFYIGLKPSYISHRDLGLFVDLKQLGNLPFNISGEAYGSIKNIKGRNVRFDFGAESSISTSFDINGLPNINETFLYLNIKDLYTTPADLRYIMAYDKVMAYQLPKSLDNLGNIHYKGSLTGFLSDIVAFGEFSTDLGSITTDIGLKVNDKQGLVFAGNLATSDFNVGGILGASERMDHLFMEVSIQGNRKSSESFYAFMDGVVDSLEINRYNYKNITLNGLFANNRFDGSFGVDDPNGKLAFNGKIDLSEEEPNFDFKAIIEGAKLDKLNLLPKIVDNELSMVLTSNFTGKDINDVIGYITVNNAEFISPEHNVRMDSLLLISVREGDEKHIVLQSDLMEGDLIGTYNFTYFRQIFIKHIQQYLPALENLLPQKEVRLRENDFTFSCRLKKMSELMNLLQPDLVVSDDGIVLGKFNSKENVLDLTVELGEFEYKELILVNPELQIASNDKNDLSIITRCKEVLLNESSLLQNFSLHNLLYNDSVQVNAYWNNWSEVNNSGSIHAAANIKSNTSGLYASINVEPSYVMVKDSIWEIQATRINYHPMGLSMRNFRIHHNNQELGINGFLHKTAEDGLEVHMQNIRLGDIVSAQNVEGLSLDGLLNGNVHVADFYRTPIVTSELKVADFVFNDDQIGDFYLNTDYMPAEKRLAINSKIQKGESQPLLGGGYVDMNTLAVDLNYKLDSLEIGFLNLYLKKIMQNLSGTASGGLAVQGKITEPELVGKVNINKAFFDVDLLQTTYSVSDSIIFKPHQIDFRSMTVRDRYGKEGSFNGVINHTGFHNMTYNLALLTNNMLVLDTRFKDNPIYYGTVFADGNMSITGRTDDLIIDISGQTKSNTLFYIPLTSDEVIEESNFIRFAKPKLDQNEAIDEVPEEDYLTDFSGMTVTMDLDITPDAQTQVIFDSKIGDILKGSGNGNLQIRMDKEGGVNFFGDFSFVEGDYLFTLQNVLNKRFIINQGSKIRWDGDPYDAKIDLNATYKLKASLYDLVRSTITDEQMLQDYSRRIPVHCNLLLNDRLMKPNIKFQIETPSAQKNNQDVIDAYINTEEELNRQVLSLLVLNRFFTDDNLSNTVSDGNRSTGNNAALVTTSEMLSNQLSHWLSQISSDFDIGVSYRPGEEGISNDEIEVALSTQVFNNRVTINGNVGYGQDNTRTSNLIGDFDVDVKLNQSGTLRGKAYTVTNNDIIYTESPTRQGVGISFKEEFDSVRELMRKYWRKFTGEGKKEDDE